jgi:hypothetical protein
MERAYILAYGRTSFVLLFASLALAGCVAVPHAHDDARPVHDVTKSIPYKTSRLSPTAPELPWLSSNNQALPNQVTVAAGKPSLSYVKLLPQFEPWQPKSPSAIFTFSDAVVRPTMKETVASVMSRVVSGTKINGRLFGAPGGAVLLDIDRIEQDGMPVPEKRHVPPDTRDADWHFSFSQLFNPTRVRTRISAYVLTDQPLQFDGSLLTYADAKRWLGTGQVITNPSNSSLAAPITPKHQLVLLIYEFYGVEGSPQQEFVPHAAVDGLKHLENFGIRLR